MREYTFIAGHFQLTLSTAPIPTHSQFPENIAAISAFMAFSPPNLNTLLLFYLG